MAWNPNIKKGVDQPNWDWLAPMPQGASNPGAGNAYDGTRYIYWAVQFGSTTANSTSQLLRYDTWTDGWQYLATLGSGFSGMDVEFDGVRNCVYIILGGTTAVTTWYTFNLNTTAITVANQSCAAFSLTTMTLVLPAVATLGSSFTMANDNDVPATIDTCFIRTGSTTTVLLQDATLGTFRGFGFGLIGLMATFTTGALTGQSRLIASVQSPTQLTLATALGGTPAVGDEFIIELPEGTATSGSSTTLVATGSGWTTNQYAFSDVVITGGTGVGQRRRIASHTNDTLTLAAAVTGNARTGNWSTPPDATSTFRIVPSSDFLYFQPGNGTTTFYKLDVVATTGTAWSAALGALPAGVSGGGNVMWAQAYDPFGVLAVRGAGTASVYRYLIGTNTWSTITTYFGSEIFSTGSSVAMIHGRRRVFISKDSSTRTYMMDLTTGILEPGPQLPYNNPAAYDGHRSRFVKTPDGVEWLYHLRPGGQEYFRVPLDWLV